jgi:murein tripeptide amidase MpaA
MTGIFSISVLMCKTVQVNVTKVLLARILIFTVMLVQACVVSAQNKSTDQNNKARQVLADRGEIEIRFVRPADQKLEFLTGILSIDRVNHDTIYVYVNEEQFRTFLAQSIPYEIIATPRLSQAKTTEISTVNWRTHYPSYSRYLAVMDSFVMKYPGLCDLTDVATTPNGHKLLAMRISVHAGSNESKPAVLLTSSIHGDEPLGFVLLLRLIEDLLSRYGTNAEITTLVDSTEIWINPLANPDGTYFLSDSTIYGATRFNANHVDLNRNFPDPVKGDHPDSYNWQTETVAMMNFMKFLHPVLAANFHGGSEVVNYPWESFSQLHPDDAWYRMISRQWVDTAHAYSYPGYMTAEEDGITNGYSWYPVYGGRQDYVNYFIHGREVTIELSYDKIPDETDLDNYWKYNYRSLLQYIEQVHTGISGIISDSLTGLPVEAMISIPGHDEDNSRVYSDSTDGYYCRLAEEGNYVIDISAFGYASKQVPVKIEKGRLTRTNVKLTQQVDFLIYPNPFSDVLRINISEPGRDLELQFTDLSGRIAKHITKTITAAGRQDIRIDGLAPGMYIVEMTYGDFKTSERILKIR